MQRGIIDMKETSDMDQRHHEILHEKHQDSLDAILEYVRDIPSMKEDISELKSEVRSLKFDVKLLQFDMRDVKDRLTKLEAR
jgi:hypothetical protein